MFWDQGEAAAPALVHRCIESWRLKNPDWEIKVLDLDEASGYVSRDKTLLVQHYSDLLRLKLLSVHGGVWVDATALCSLSLDSWLDLNRGSCFIRSDYPDRLLENWFIAAGPSHPLIEAWLKSALQYWDYVATNRHYFVHHYIFDWLVSTKNEMASHWTTSQKLPIAPARMLRIAMRAGDAADAEKDNATFALRSQSTPMHKLDWRIPDGASILDYFLSRAKHD